MPPSIFLRLSPNALALLKDLGGNKTLAVEYGKRKAHYARVAGQPDEAKRYEAAATELEVNT